MTAAAAAVAVAAATLPEDAAEKEIKSLKKKKDETKNNLALTAELARLCKREIIQVGGPTGAMQGLVSALESTKTHQQKTQQQQEQGH